ncbi:hypothetical protein M406DRAFT_335786 [Cryphonectria parasitica EP155]|uniref:Nudix hydrolase domain-containing protein n=1 Tax=Cryphonectria parasitica (strain ATCC 38755 / EP155) TaxID=660469 RepID=A0A9P5CT71_CRYP1|nr:uncharacterized protein M406DRAFT_335786 [Cryphonectria parasitica EP155]KAF3770028.1 hypothetical protein M406DRAFT_335786 [Cryphonectria parasitica EP155]
METTQKMKTNLDLVNECDSTNPGEDYYAFHLPQDPRPHGYMPSAVVEQMPWTADFEVSPKGHLPRTVRLLDTSSGTATTTACNASLAALIHRAQEQGVFAKTLGRKAEGEDFRIMGASSLIQMRRSAAPLFGIANRGAHMTVYLRHPATGAYSFWIPRRSSHLATYPGMLDNTVAGGTRAEETPLECIVHEADEEASLPADFVSRHARAAGTLTYVTRTGAGDQQAEVGGYDTGLCCPDVIYVYDLEIPADQAEAVVPRPRDDEVEQFYLWDLDTVRAAMARGEFKANTALVLLDFFVRHGIVTDENEPDYVEIVSRLHRRVPVPTAPARSA